MANTKIENLVNKLNRAKHVIDATSTNEFDQYAKNLTENMDFGGTDPYSSYIPSSESKSFNRNENISDDSYKFSKMPKEIVESIKSKPLVVKEVTDDAMEELVKRVSPKMNISEETSKEKPKFSDYMNKNTNQGGIDYSLIKLIVNDAIKESLSEMKKELLTENNKGKKLSYMKLGDSLQFLDSDGNLYEAKLTFKRNIRNKK